MEFQTSTSIGCMERPKVSYLNSKRTGRILWWCLATSLVVIVILKTNLGNVIFPHILECVWLIDAGDMHIRVVAHIAPYIVSTIDGRGHPTHCAITVAACKFVPLCESHRQGFCEAPRFEEARESACWGLPCGFGGKHHGPCKTCHPQTGMDILVSLCTPSKLGQRFHSRLIVQCGWICTWGSGKGEFFIEAFCCLMTSVHSMLGFWRNSTINTLYFYNKQGVCI